MKKSNLIKLVKNSVGAIVISAAVFTLSSCDPAQAAIDDLEALTEDVEQNGDSFTDEDWNESINTFGRLLEETSQHEYTDEQRREIGRLKGRYIGALTQQKIKEWGDSISSWGSDVKNEIEGYIESFDADTAKQRLNEMGEDLKDLGKELQGGLEGFIESFDEDESSPSI